MFYYCKTTLFFPQRTLNARSQIFQPTNYQYGLRHLEISINLNRIEHRNTPQLQITNFSQWLTMLALLLHSSKNSLQMCDIQGIHCSFSYQPTLVIAKFTKCSDVTTYTKLPISNEVSDMHYWKHSKNTVQHLSWTIYERKCWIKVLVNGTRKIIGNDAAEKFLI